MIFFLLNILANIVPKIKCKTSTFLLIPISPADINDLKKE